MPSSPSTSLDTTSPDSTSLDTMAPGLSPVDPDVLSRSAADRLFDVCHGGVMLRALLCVHGVLALALGWKAPTWQDWLSEGSLAVLVVLPAVLLWLLLACGLRGGLVRLPRGLYWAALMGLGAGCATLARAGWQVGLQPLLAAPAAAPGLPGPMPWLLAALTGAALAAAMLHWLEQRQQLRQPVAAAARLAELQARIRPHFLFNALNSAVALVRVDPARAEAVLEDLADLFRAALADAGEQTTLGEEIELARRYLAIEQVRFGNRLVVHWHLDPAADAARLPPLVLQPLVENAVKHGIEPLAAGGELQIRTQVRRGQAAISITNRVGAGTARKGQGMALRNVRERLLLLHDLTMRFEAGRIADDRYRVRIVVPMAPPTRESA
jgi:two-component system sensor histidine kinase AlgZ